MVRSSPEHTTEHWHIRTTSVVSLLISAVAMPASFVAEVVLFNALGRVAELALAYVKEELGRPA